LLFIRRKLHNEKLSDLYCSPNIVQVIKSRRMKWAGHVARMGERRGMYRVSVGKPDGKRPVVRLRRVVMHPLWDPEVDEVIDPIKLIDLINMKMI
jgi:hypothetical protein